MANADDTAGDSIDVLQRIGTQGARTRLSKKDEQRCSRLTRSIESVPIRQLQRSLSSPTILQVLSSQHGVTIVLGDVDHFKRVNDTYGDTTGDEVLREVAYRLHDSVRSYDAVSRYGGEEFLVVLNGCRTPVRCQSRREHSPRHQGASHGKRCGSCVGFDKFWSGRHRRLAVTER